MSDKPEMYDDFISSIGSIETRPLFPYKKWDRTRLAPKQHLLNEWKEISDKVIGFPSLTLSSYNTCIEYGINIFLNPPV
jgi:hypothetical protein